MVCCTVFIVIVSVGFPLIQCYHMHRVNIVTFKIHFIISKLCHLCASTTNTTDHPLGDVYKCTLHCLFSSLFEYKACRVLQSLSL